MPRKMQDSVKRSTAMRKSRIKKRILSYTDAELRKSIRNAKRRIKESEAAYKDDIRRAKKYRKDHSEYSVKFLPLAIEEMKKRRGKKK